MSSHPLNKEQLEAVQHGEGPLLMAAGAGSGKTRALTSRLKFLIDQGLAPEKIIAITFTNKAANEMRKRVFGEKHAAQRGLALPSQGLPFIGTFHSLGLRILKNEIESAGRRPGPSIYDDNDSLRLIKNTLKNLNLNKEKYKAALLRRDISRIKSELINIESLTESGREEDEVFRQVFLDYERQLKADNAFDFDDLIEKPVRLFLSHKEIREKYQNLFEYVLVDEYQDINTAQYQLVRLLVERHNNINVVGDDFQSIYAFRQADFRNFLNFGKDWPQAKIIKLEQAYRSTKTIIEAANAVIANNTRQTPKKLWTENEQGEPIKIIGARNQEDEALWLASEIKSLQTQNKGGSVAVLYRTNAQSRSVEQALLQWSIPYKIFGGVKFYDRKEIKDIVSALRIALNPLDSAAQARLESSLGKRRTQTILNRFSELREKNSLVCINAFLESIEYLKLLEQKYLNAQERIENIAELARFASEFESLEELMERIALLEAGDQGRKSGDEREQLVSLMTIHIAKGLEFDSVFLIGVTEGVLPHEKSMLRKEEVEEERRLMYVALTRARSKLFLSYYAMASRFLYEIPQELCSFQDGDGSEGWPLDEEDIFIE
ncbi:MAG: UvrD-helicase domain-containing protein [Candidatus Harrisonbacteria bacterium]|nr:UvrD-helicase domain-containing protein [Candidatus Harrisonbacteria bacterium]